MSWKEQQNEHVGESELEIEQKKEGDRETRGGKWRERLGEKNECRTLRGDSTKKKSKSEC